MLDGGAYKGNKAIIMLELFPHAEVHCFEPQPEPFRNLQQRFCNEPRCSVMQAALSDVGGAAQMFVTQNMYTSSLLKPIAMDIEARSVIDVVVTTIDQYMDTQGLRSFDFIKLDLQGNELKALLEIGRASCRERVFQYCLISVVAVCFKKKTLNNYRNLYIHT